MPVIEGEKAPFYKEEGFKRGALKAAVIAGTILIAIGMVYLEVVRRAKAAYERGEASYTQKEYKKALWSYQEVQEFYDPPRTSYVAKAEEKEWICRAYLGDWVPPEGPMDADMRVLHPEVYQKYQSKIAQITPVGDTSYQAAPPTNLEKDLAKKQKKK